MPRSLPLTVAGLCLATAAQAQLTAGIYDLSSAPPVRSSVHVFSFRDDVFRFDDQGRSRDYDRGADRFGMLGGFQPIRGPLAGPPVYGPEVFAPDQAVRIRVVMELADPSRVDEAPDHLVLRFAGPDGAPVTVRAQRKHPGGEPVQGRKGKDEHGSRAGVFADADDSLVNGRMYRLPRQEGESRVAWTPLYEATLDLADVYDRSPRSVAESFAILGGADGVGDALAAALGGPEAPAGAPSQRDAENALQTWVKVDASGHRAVKHRRGHKTAAVIPFVVERPDGTALVGGSQASDEDLRQARLVVRHVPDWLYLGGGSACGAEALAPRDFVGASLEGAVELLMLGPCAPMDTAKEDFETSDGPNRYYLVRPDGYWWWRVSQATVAGFRTPPDAAAAAATVRAFLDRLPDLSPPEHPPVGKDWNAPEYRPGWQAYSQGLARAWVAAGRQAGTDAVAIDVDGAFLAASGAVALQEWEPQGTGFLGLEVSEALAFDDATREADRRGERIVQRSDREQAELRSQIPEIQTVRAELIDIFRSRPPESLELLFDQPSYQRLARRFHTREAARLREKDVPYTEARRDQYETGLRLEFSEYVLVMEREIYRDFGRIDTDHGRMGPVERALYLATHTNSSVAASFPEEGDSFEAAVGRAYTLLSPPYETGSRGYLGPLEGRTDGRAKLAKLRIRRAVLRKYLENRYAGAGVRGLSEFMGVADRRELITFFSSPAGRPLVGTLAKHDPELAKLALAAGR